MAIVTEIYLSGRIPHDSLKDIFNWPAETTRLPLERLWKGSSSIQLVKGIKRNMVSSVFNVGEWLEFVFGGRQSLNVDQILAKVFIDYKILCIIKVFIDYCIIAILTKVFIDYNTNPRISCINIVPEVGNKIDFESITKEVAAEGLKKKPFIIIVCIESFRGSQCPIYIQDPTPNSTKFCYACCGVLSHSKKDSHFVADIIVTGELCC